MHKMPSDEPLLAPQERFFFQKLLAATGDMYQVAATKSLHALFDLSVEGIQATDCKKCFSENTKFLLFGNDNKSIKLIITLKSDFLPQCADRENQFVYTNNSCAITKMPTLSLKQPNILSSETLKVIIRQTLENSSFIVY